MTILKQGILIMAECLVRNYKMNKSIDRLIRNYCNARKSWEVWCYLSGLDNEFKTSKKEVQQIVDDNPLFFHLRYLSMKDYYIELYKVIKESSFNADNIFNLLQKRIKSNPKNIDEVKKALNGLSEIKETIVGFCNIRDKFYAHLDKDFEKYINKGKSLKETNQLFFAIEKGMCMGCPGKEL